MGERRGEANETRLLIDCRHLHSGDLMAAEGLAYDVEPARQCRIAKGLIVLARMGRPDGRNERLLWIGELCLRLGERGGAPIAPPRD
jgi:hypothetical protein